MARPDRPRPIDPEFVKKPLALSRLGNVGGPQFFSSHRGLLPALNAPPPADNGFFVVVGCKCNFGIRRLEDQGFLQQIEASANKDRNELRAGGGVIASGLPNSVQRSRQGSERAVGSF